MSSSYNLVESILLGVFVFLSIFIIIYYVVQRIKKKAGSNKGGKDNDE